MVIAGDPRRRSHELVAVAGAVGAVTGLVVAGLDSLAVDGALDRVLDLPLGLLAVAPAIGLIGAALVLRFGAGGAGPSTADEYLHGFHDPSYRLSLRTLLARLVAAVLTIGSGVPMGLEGPALYAGAAIGANTQGRVRRLMRPGDHQTLMVAGAAAGVAAIFKAPATGVVFALEVPYRDDLARRMLLPAMVASAAGYLTFVAVHGTKPLFDVAGAPTFSATDLLGAIGLGLAAGLAARGFAWLVQAAKRMHRFPVLWRAAAAGVALATLFAIGRALTGENLAVTPGYPVVAWVGRGGHSIALLSAVLVLRCIATPTAIAGGGVGGIFIPLVTGGALVGQITGQTIGSNDTGLFTLIGIAAFLGAGYRVPLAAVVFVAETTGRPGFIVPGLLAAVTAELAMGRWSVTTYQVDMSLISTEEPDPEVP